MESHDRFPHENDIDQGMDLEAVSFHSEESVARYISRSLGGSERAEATTDFDALNELRSQLPKWLHDLGLQGANSINTEDVEVMIANGYADIYDVEDLFFETYDEVLQKLGHFTRVDKDDLMDNVEKKELLEIKQKQNDEAIKYLSSLGINSDDILDLRGGADRKSRHLRRLDWLLKNEPILEEYVSQLENTKETGVKIPIISVIKSAHEILSEAFSSLKSMDTQSMGRVDKKWAHAEIRRVGYVLNLSKSVHEGLSSTEADN